MYIHIHTNVNAYGPRAVPESHFGQSRSNKQQAPAGHGKFGLLGRSVADRCLRIERQTCENIGSVLVNMGCCCLGTSFSQILESGRFLRWMIAFSMPSVPHLQVSKICPFAI